MRRPTVPPSHRRDRLAALRLSHLHSDLFGFFLVGFLIKTHGQPGQAGQESLTTKLGWLIIVGVIIESRLLQSFYGYKVEGIRSD